MSAKLGSTRGGPQALTGIGAVLAVLSCAGLLTPHPARAESLQDALALAYTNNPALAAERDKLRAVDEGVPEALSGWRPTVTAEAEGGVGHETAAETGVPGQTSAGLTPRDIGINVTEPLYRGGRTTAGTKQAEENVLQERAQLVSSEQTLLVNAATAYLDVLTDQAVLDLNVNNEHVLQRDLDATRERFKVGELTRTDVSQSESRLARADADRSAAEGNLSIARTVYNRLIGQMPGQLQKLDLTFSLPQSKDSTVEQALKFNPIVIAADSGERAADANVDLVRGNLLPEVSLQGSANENWDEEYPLNRVSDEQILAQIKIPLYTAGADYARLRAAYEQKSQARMLLDDSKRQAEQQAVQAWEQLQTAESEITARQAQIKSAQIALDGVKQEERVGTRTILDTLDAEQEYLDAQVGAVRAERDRAVAVFQMLAAVGQFTAEKLKLNVDLYDPLKHYNDVRDSWFGIGDSSKNDAQ